MAGRTPKPIPDRLEEGTYNARIHGPIDPNIFFIGEPLDSDPPDCLCPWGRDVWRKLYDVVTKSGQVTESERQLFIAYCDACGIINRATEAIKREGLFMQRKKPGRKKKSPVTGLVEDEWEEGAVPNKWELIKEKATKRMMGLARLLGLTTIDRARVVRKLTPEELAAQDAEKMPETRPKTGLDFLSAG